MYCEARTSTGLGCDSLGLEQCDRCAAPGIPCSRAAYTMGWDKPNYPMPATTDLPTYDILCDHLLWVYYDEQIEAWMRARGM